MSKAIHRGPFLALILYSIVALGICVGGGTADAQSAATLVRAPADTPSLKLEGLLNEATARNQRIAAAGSLADAADARVKSASRPPDPQLQVGLMNYGLGDLKPMPVIGMQQLQVMQMLPLGGKLRLAGRAASASADAERARASAVVWTVRRDVSSAFYDIYQTDRALDVAQQALRSLEDISRTSQAMYRVGQAQQVDVLRANVETARMAEDTIRMRSMRTALVARLNALLNRADSASVGPAILPLFPSTLPSLESLISIANERSPMIRSGVATLEQASADNKRAVRELWPDLQLGIQLGRQGGPMGTEWMGSLMVGASIPIFARSRQLPMRKEYQAMKRMASADLEQMRADNRWQISEAYADLQRARNLQALYGSTIIPQADAAAASAFASYRVGTVNFMTLLEDRMTVRRYQQSLHELEASEGKAWADLEMLLGANLIAHSDTAAVPTGVTP